MISRLETEWCSAKVILLLRDPTAWAASRVRNHGEDPICAERSGGLGDRLDLQACAQTCATATGDLRACLTTQSQVAQESLAAAFNRSQQRLITKYGGRALVIDLFAEGKSREAEVGFLHSLHHQLRGRHQPVIPRAQLLRRRWQRR